MNRFTNVYFILLLAIWSENFIFVHSTDYHEQKSSTSDDDGGFSPANYKFQYAVNEASSGNDFGHEEERNGHQTKGQYRVLLPNGLLQIVTYTADQNGYSAKVTYENQGGGSGYSYSPPPAPAPAAPSPSKTYVPPPADQGYSSGASSPSGSGHSNSYGKRNSGSFVKLRNKINGRNYNYSF